MDTSSVRLTDTVDSSLTTILNWKPSLFANPHRAGRLRRMAMASDLMPLDVLFWCVKPGPLYPFNGQVSNESSPLQSSVLVSERMASSFTGRDNYGEYREGQGISAGEYPPRSSRKRWRYQMVNMYLIVVSAIRLTQRCAGRPAKIHPTPARTILSGCGVNAIVSSRQEPSQRVN
jgi:hypothetical protein